MPPINRRIAPILVATVLVAFSDQVAAQEAEGAAQPWAWPDSLENLQVLPAHWSGDRLRPVMFGFTNALGVRCSYCHVGEEGQPLSAFDFVSDENPNKDRAREMLRMLGSINDHLDRIEPSGDERVNMWCHTCHRGRPRPMTLEEELGEQYRMHGVEAALGRYDSLKTRFYGRGAYDFDEDALNALGYEVLEAEDAEGAIAVFTLNSELFPESANAWDSLAEAHMAVGSNDLAIKYYEESLRLNPRNRNAVEMLERLREER